MTPLVSVAIAAYNVEKFLVKGISYIQNQTYSNIEIILVDDGSTDKTPALCDQLAETDSRIRVFHKKNGGLGSARNVGIDNANGEFLFFFDVDDSIDPDFLSDSVRLASEKKADLIIYGYYARSSNSKEEELITVKEHEIHQNSDLKRVYCDELLWMKHGNGFAWNKFYRMSFLKKYNFHFGNQRIQQDEPFNMQLYPRLENVYVCPKAYYHYVIYDKGNAGTRYLPDKADIIVDVYHKFMHFYSTWELDNEQVLKYIQNRFLTGIFGVVTANFYHKNCRMSKTEKEDKIRAILSDNDVVTVLRETKIMYSKNPVNLLQIWAFNHRKTRILMLATELKQNLKRLEKRG